MHRLSNNYPIENYLNSYNKNTVMDYAYGSTSFQDTDGIDFGIRLADLNNDGYIDILQGRESTSEKKIWLNNKTGWNQRCY